MQESIARKYSVGEREEAVRLAGEIGLTAAASKLNIPVPTVSHWLRKLRIAAEGAGASQASQSKARRYTAGERAEGIRLAGELGLTASASRLGIPVTTLSGWLRLQVAEKKQSDAGLDSPPQASATESAPPAPVAAEPATQPQAQRQVAKAYTPSERARALEFAAREGVTAAAIKFSIRASQFTNGSGRRGCMLRGRCPTVQSWEATRTRWLRAITGF